MTTAEKKAFQADLTRAVTHLKMGLLSIAEADHRIDDLIAGHLDNMPRDTAEDIDRRCELERKLYKLKYRAILGALKGVKTW